MAPNTTYPLPIYNVIQSGSFGALFKLKKKLNRLREYNVKWFLSFEETRLELKSKDEMLEYYRV